METHFKFGFGHNLIRACHRWPLRRFLGAAVVMAVLVSLGAATKALVDGQDKSGAAAAQASGGIDFVSAQLTVPLAPSPAHGDNDDQPDRAADFVGGVAARVRADDGQPIPGDLFLLMATEGSAAHAQLFDDTPYGLDRIQIRPEVVDSNRQAVRTIETITGTDLQMVEFTSAPGGGNSAGITYAIAYLNIVSDGAFTGDLVVAATGRLMSHGYVFPINSVNEKTAAAHLAGADVLFTPSLPTAEVIEVHGTRAVGELFRARNTRSGLGEERQWTNYDRWGADRPVNGMDVVGIRHLGDVAAYLCGAGSEFACDIQHRLEIGVPAGAGTALAPTPTPTPTPRRSIQ